MRRNTPRGDPLQKQNYMQYLEGCDFRVKYRTDTNQTKRVLNTCLKLILVEQIPVPLLDIKYIDMWVFNHDPLLFFDYVPFFA